MSVVCRQRGSSPASCASLQSRQFPAHAGNAGADQGLVDDDAARKAYQDRREGREPWALRRVPNGRGRDSEELVCRHSAAHRGAATAAGHFDRVRRSSVRASLREKRAMMRKKQAISAVSRSSSLHQPTDRPAYCHNGKRHRQAYIRWSRS